MPMNRRALIAATLALPFAAPARAHHGWMKWDEENPFFIEGWISKEMDGFPHWEIDVRVDGEDWEVDVGDQFSLKKAGLKPDGSDFRLRREIKVIGLRSADPGHRRILPRQVVFDGDPEKTYDLFVDG